MRCYTTTTATIDFYCTIGTTSVVAVVVAAAAQQQVASSSSSSVSRIIQFRGCIWECSKQRGKASKVVCSSRKLILMTLMTVNGVWNKTTGGSTDRWVSCGACSTDVKTHMCEAVAVVCERECL
jgi:hypothetical protein